MRVVVDQDNLVGSPLFVNDDEQATAATGTPTVTVTNSAGTVLAAPTVTASGATGRYNAALTAAVHCVDFDQLDLVWVGTVATKARRMTQQVEVVGGRLFSLAELRAEPGMESTAQFPLDVLRAVREECEDYVEQWCGVAFNRRYTVETLHGGGGTSVAPTWALPRTIRLIDGTVGNVSGWLFNDAGRLERLTGGSIAEVAVGYEHGYLYPPPKLAREVIRWARKEVVQRSARVSADHLSETVDGNTVRYALPDRSMLRPTGVLALDPVLAEYRRTVFVG